MRIAGVILLPPTMTARKFETVAMTCDLNFLRFCVLKTLKVRIKDKHAAELNEMSRSVNFIWNYINELSGRCIKERGIFLSSFDIWRYTVGAHKDLGLHSCVAHRVAVAYCSKRKQLKRRYLKWRSSFGKKRSLGWVPFRSDAIQFKNGQIHHNGTYFKIWDSYGLSKYKLRSGSFNEDSRGRWYINIAVEDNHEISSGKSSVGIDLGLKDCATTSDGEKLTGKWFRCWQERLACAQRAKKKKRIRAIHAKIANQRKDAQHKFSRELVNKNAAIFVGSVATAAMIKTKMAKSTLDAGWASLKTMLEYKSHQAGIVFEVIDESYSTQTCSCCGVIPDSSPKGRAGLGIREWTCTECGEHHDRDVNAAKNILAAGHRRLAEGISRYNGDRMPNDLCVD